ncbi:hypothetical protein H5410_051151 [Solanum commersonii]|uniref:Polyprotein protein n=1 Tax=Solanum commersonii TaxID=4109 RepID=A0A9J5WZN2_SOLCO|nr:hypothetical protein H5410_051151 [Solanum commersonii]
MGHLAQYADVWASQLEAVIPGMIERSIATALTPLRSEINRHKLSQDALTMRVRECEKGQEATNVVTALKADIIGLRRDVDQLKSTDFTSLFGMVEIPNGPSINSYGGRQGQYRAKRRKQAEEVKKSDPGDRQDHSTNR